MNSLLNKEEFDSFLLKEALIKTSNTYHIDGLENRDYYDNDEDIINTESPYDYAMWGKIRSNIRSLIVGKHPPVAMKITLYLKPDLMDSIIPDTEHVLDYFIMNIHFALGKMNITTGIAYKNFTLDKEFEHEWDKYVLKLLMSWIK